MVWGNALAVPKISKNIPPVSKPPSMDAGFEQNGGYITKEETAGFSSNVEYGVDIAVTDKNIIVFGNCAKDASKASHMTVWSYDHFGLPNKQFHGNGHVISPDISAAAKGVLDENGNIVAVGKGQYVKNQSGGASEFTALQLWRYKGDGQEDTSFNGTGTKTIASGEPNELFWGMDVAIDPQGRIVVVALAWTSSDFAIAEGYHAHVFRLLDNGEFDASFGENGSVEVNIPQTTLYKNQIFPRGLIIDDDDRIVITGMAWVGPSPPVYMFVTRLTEVGKIDTTFGFLGFVLSSNAAQGGADHDHGKDIVRSSDGGFYVGGYSTYAIKENYGKEFYFHDVAVWKFDKIGSLDKAFGKEGHATFHISPDNGSEQPWWAIAYDPMYKRILLTGTTVDKKFLPDEDEEVAIWCFTDKGDICKGFGPGNNGYVILDAGAKGLEGRGLAVQGRYIYIAGKARHSVKSNKAATAMGVWRFDRYSGVMQ